MSRDASADEIEDILDELRNSLWTRKVEALRIATARLASGELGQDQETRLVTQLIEAAKHQKWEVRKAATLALAECRHFDNAIQQVLNELARDANRWVSQAADRAIHRLRSRVHRAKEWTLTADTQDSILQHIASKIRDIGLRSMTPVQIYDLAMEIREQSYRELAADTAHEIRTLLTPFQGYLAELRRHLDARGQVDATAEHYLTASLGRLQQIQMLTENLRTYGAPGETNFAPVELITLVREAVAIGSDHLATAPKAQITRVVEVPHGVVVHALRERLTRAIANVITNACQAMPRGGRLTVQARRAGVDLVEITVSDTGHGMTAEMAEQARLRFRTTRRDEGGTGLGLPIAERIVVHDHRGELHIDSSIGKGTTVTIKLPWGPKQ